MTQLIINQELRDLLPPLSDEEMAGLEAAILRDGCTDPLTVWGETIVDGHHRHAICTKHDIPFKTTQKEFDSLVDAKIWMCERQDSRRNLTLYQRAIIALKMKSVFAEKAKQNQKQSKGPGKKGLSNLTNLNTRFQLSKKFKISAGTLHMVEFLELHASEETKQKLRMDETSINKEFTRLKAELDAQKPKKEKKSRSTPTTATKETPSGGNPKSTHPASSKTKTKAREEANDSTQSSFFETPDTTENDDPGEKTPETVVAPLKSRRKVADKYCCDVSFDPDPDDNYFDWITEVERAELRALQANCPNRLVPSIHNFTIQNIPEHSPEPLLSCLYFLFKVGYRKKLAYALLRRMFVEDGKELTQAIVADLCNEFQNQ